jgi:protein TonB
MVARRMGMQGVVVLRVHVRADGSVAEAELAQSSGSQLLDDSALKTVREQWRFLPARLDGEPVESYVEVPIRFVLDAS